MYFCICLSIAEFHINRSVGSGLPTVLRYTESFVLRCHARSLELVHTIIITRACYVLAVDRFGDLQAVETVPFSIKLTIIFDTIIAFTVQVCYSLCPQKSSLT